MTEKLALQIAYNILNEELDTQNDYDAGDEEYYQEIKNAIEKIQEMIKRAVR